MKQFQDFSEADSYFCGLFSNEEGIFSQIKIGDIPVGIALQHNIYDYYKNFIHATKVKTPIAQRLLSLARIYGMDHRFKLILNFFWGTRNVSIAKGKTIFFVDNYVPRILEDFLKVIKEMDTSSIAFVTTDYRAYKYMRKKAGPVGLQILLLGSGFTNRSGPADIKKVLNDGVVTNLQKEFNGFAKNILKIISLNLCVLVNYHRLFEKYLEQAKPAKIVLGSDGFSVARILCVVAKEKQMKTYVLQHGIIDSLNGYFPLVADYILSWSHFEKAFFQQNGVESKRLLVTGSPRFQQRSYSWTKSDKTLNSNQLLFVISPATPQDVYSQVDQIIEISRNLTRPYTILIRPHPYYKRATKAYFETLEVGESIFLDEQPFLKSLSFSEIVIFTEISTGIFEALTMNKRIYILANQSRNKFDIYNFPKIEIADLIQELNSNLSPLPVFDLLHSSNKQMPPMSNNASIVIASYLNASH